MRRVADLVLLAGVAGALALVLTETGSGESPAASASLCWCTASSGFSTPYWRSSGCVWRLSSQAMALTNCSTYKARRLMSARLPMGVATMYSVASG